MKNRAYHSCLKCSPNKVKLGCDVEDCLRPPGLPSTTTEGDVDEEHSEEQTESRRRISKWRSIV